MRGSGSLSRENGDPHRDHLAQVVVVVFTKFLTRNIWPTGYSNLAQDPFIIENEDPPGVHDLPELATNREPQN